MAAIIKMSQNEWVKFFFVQNGWIQDGFFVQRIQEDEAAIIKLSENEWVKFFFVQNGWNQDGRIQDGWHHQIEWEWMSLSQIELVWVTKFCWIQWWQNPRWQNSRWLPSSQLSQNEWVWVRLNQFESESEWHASVSEWISEKITRCLTPIWPVA